MGLRRPNTRSGDLGRGDEQSRGSIVLVLPRRSGGTEEGLGRVTLTESLDLKLRRGGERRLWSRTTAGEGGGEPVSTIWTVTIGVVEKRGRGGSDRRLKAKRRPVSCVSGRERVLGACKMVRSAMRREGTRKYVSSVKLFISVPVP